MSKNHRHIIELDNAVCKDPADSSQLEWWLANGLGGYAGGTVCGELSRRYHGLLVAPVVSPLGRMLLLARADATLVIDDKETPLYSNRWNQGERVPESCCLERFYLDADMPVWQFRVGQLTLEQRIWMPHGSQQVCLAWRLVGGGDPAAAESSDTGPLLRIGLLASFRDHHAVSQVGGFDINTGLGEQGLQLHFP